MITVFQFFAVAYMAVDKPTEFEEARLGRSKRDKKSNPKFSSMVERPLITAEYII